MIGWLCASQGGENPVLMARAPPANEPTTSNVAAIAITSQRRPPRSHDALVVGENVAWSLVEPLRPRRDGGVAVGIASKRRVLRGQAPTAGTESVSGSAIARTSASAKLRASA